jgi:hypothetical protein
MAIGRQIPGGPFVNETQTKGRQIPGGPFVNEIIVTTTVGRPVSDISTTDWAPSTPAAPLYSMIDEVAYDDADYIYSAVSGISDAIFGISPTMAVGDRTVNFRAFTTSSTVQMRVRLLDSGGASVGVTSYQTITTSPTTYSLAITLTGVAARASIETIP